MTCSSVQTLALYKVQGNGSQRHRHLEQAWQSQASEAPQVETGICAWPSANANRLLFYQPPV